MDQTMLAIRGHHQQDNWCLKTPSSHRGLLPWRRQHYSWLKERYVKVCLFCHNGCITSHWCRHMLAIIHSIQLSVLFLTMILDCQLRFPCQIVNNSPDRNSQSQFEVLAAFRWKHLMYSRKFAVGIHQIKASRQSGGDKLQNVARCHIHECMM